MVEVLIALLNEDVECWRPVHADELGSGLYRLQGPVPDGEVWEYQPGDVVKAEEKVFSDGERRLVATELGAA